MPQLRLNPDQFQARLSQYDEQDELALREFQARLGEDATRPKVNAFFQRILGDTAIGSAIDLGCNTGRFAADVLALRSDEIVLVDFSEAALAVARTRVPQPRLAAALALDLTASWRAITDLAPFDAVALCEVIQHMPCSKDRERVFRQAADLLRPNGLMFFSNVFCGDGEPSEGFYQCDRSRSLLYWRRSNEAENQARFEQAGLTIVERFREEKSEAFLLQRSV